MLEITKLISNIKSLITNVKRVKNIELIYGILFKGQL